MLLEEGVCHDQCVLLANSISLYPASFCIPRPNLPVTPDDTTFMAESEEELKSLLMKVKV